MPLFCTCARNYLQFFLMSAFKRTVCLLDVFVSSVFQVPMASEDSSVHCCCAVSAVMVPDVSKDRSAIIFRGLLHPITPTTEHLNLQRHYCENHKPRMVFVYCAFTYYKPQRLLSVQLCTISKNHISRPHVLLASFSLYLTDRCR